MAQADAPAAPGAVSPVELLDRLGGADVAVSALRALRSDQLLLALGLAAGRAVGRERGVVRRGADRDLAAWADRVLLSLLLALGPAAVGAVARVLGTPGLHVKGRRAAEAGLDVVLNPASVEIQGPREACRGAVAALRRGRVLLEDRAAVGAALDLGGLLGLAGHADVYAEGVLVERAHTAGPEGGLDALLSAGVAAVVIIRTVAVGLEEAGAAEAGRGHGSRREAKGSRLAGSRSLLSLWLDFTIQFLFTIDYTIP